MFTRLWEISKAALIRVYRKASKVSGFRQREEVSSKRPPTIPFKATSYQRQSVQEPVNSHPPRFPTSSKEDRRRLRPLHRRQTSQRTHLPTFTSLPTVHPLRNELYLYLFQLQQVRRQPHLYQWQSRYQRQRPTYQVSPFRSKEATYRRQSQRESFTRQPTDRRRLRM